MATILIVDDHPAFRLIIKMHLSPLSGVTEIYETDNGQSAVEMTRQHLPDLAIVDLDIPRISGLDVIPRLRLVHPSICVLVLSGQDPATFVPRVMHTGAQGFVSKTLEMKDIVRSVEAVLAGYTVFPAAPGGRAARPVAEASTEEDQLKQLSDKELTILQMLSKGMSNKSIGDLLFISNKTVSSHKTRIMQKLNITSLVGLVDLARRCRIVPTHVRQHDESSRVAE